MPRSVPRRYTVSGASPDDRLLLAACQPLLELFATCDDVFGEPDAFEHQASLGRIYREWKRARRAIDPDFDPKTWRTM